MAKGAWIGVEQLINLGTLPIGDTVKLNVNGVATDFIIIHQGLPSSMYDSSCDGTWLLMKDIYVNGVWNSTTNNDYANSDIHAYLNDTFLGVFDSDIQSVIKQVKIPYHNGVGNSGSVASGSSGLSTKIFLLSGYEAGWINHTGVYLPIDGACLSYFSGISETNSKRIGYYRGTATYWNTRSPYTTVSTYVWCVTPSGGLGGNNSTASRGVRPALILPSNLMVTNGVVTSEVATTVSVARKIKKGYVGVESFTKRDLPSGYTQVEYIESSGTQYIDTGFKPNQDTRVVMYGYNESSNSAWIYGAWNSANSGAFAYLSVNRYYMYGSQQVTISAIPVGEFTLDHNKNSFILNGTTISGDSETFTCNYSLYLFALNVGGSVSSGKLTGKLYSCQIYDNGTLVRDYVPCKNANGTVGLYDVVNGIFYSNAGTGTFTAGANYSSVARKIKKAYIGVGGVARPFWSGGELAYYGTITKLTNTSSKLTATSVGNYALFAGGRNNDTIHANAVAYGTSLTKSDITTLSQAVFDLTATSVGNYALFAGGDTGTTGVLSKKVNVYDTSLIKSNATDISIVKRYIGAASVGNYALFVGGDKGGTGNNDNKVDAYSSSLTKTSLSNLSVAKCRMMPVSTNNHAIFAGGTTDCYNGDSALTEVVVYDKSLTRSNITALTIKRFGGSAATVGSYVVIAGGISTRTSSGNNIAGSAVNTVDVYNQSLTQLSTLALSSNRGLGAGVSLDGYALIGYGTTTMRYSSSGLISGTYSTVNAFDESLTMTTFTGNGGMVYKKANIASVRVGNYALFGGGQFGDSYTDSRAEVEAYVVA